MKRYQNRNYPLFAFLVVVVLFLLNFLTCTLGFQRPLQAADRDKDIPCEWSGIEKIVAVGDLHGAYDHFLVILKGTGLVDDNLNWIGGKTHLVQIGDVLDRGDKPRDIFELALRLEREAEEAGGKVHMMIGNHEEMNLADTAFDREGYITPEQFVQFLPEKYYLKQLKKFQRKNKSSSSENSTSNGEYLDEWKGIIDKSRDNPRASSRIFYIKNLNEMYGEWIIGHNVIIKINEIVFVHGGISETFSTWPLKEINETFRLELDDLRLAVLKNLPPKIPGYDRILYNNPLGPLWYRNLAQVESDDFADDVVRILGNLQASHIVIAHTPLTVGKEEMNKYDKKVWVIDTGISDYYRPIGGHISALIIDKGQFSVWYPEPENKDFKKNLK